MYKTDVNHKLSINSLDNNSTKENDLNSSNKGNYDD